MTQEDTPVIRIGELLVRSGVITTYDLSEAEKLSAHMKVQFGRLLIMAGCLTEEALECALEAQQLVRDGMLNSEIACEALAFAVQESIPLRQALEMLDCLPQFGTATLRLAELIHDANIIDEEKLHDAFDTSMETNRSLPEVLVEMHCISPGLLAIMTRMQEQIRNDTLDREDAINELKGTFKIWTRADKAMANDPMSKSAIITGSNAPAPAKPSRFTSSFDSVTRLPAISPETLAGLNADAAAAAKASGGVQPPAQTVPGQNAVGGPIPTPVAPFLPPPAAVVPPQALPPQALPPQVAQAPQARAPQHGGQPLPPSAAHMPSQPPMPPQEYPQQAGINTGAPPRQSGQNLPDGVILYSQGYFPPDGNASGQSFNDGFSEEDEQRINALLDVFASDSSASPSVTMPLEATPEVVQDPGDNWLFAADGWGVPDLAAAGANLTGAEMFARAQAELNNSGWSYSQAMATSSGQQIPVARDYQPQPAAPLNPPPPPLGQPLYVTPTPPTPAGPPKGLGHPDFRPPNNDMSAPPQPKAPPFDPDSPNPFKLRKTGSMPAVPADGDWKSQRGKDSDKPEPAEQGKVEAKVSEESKPAKEVESKDSHIEQQKEDQHQDQKDQEHQEDQENQKDREPSAKEQSEESVEPTSSKSNLAEPDTTEEDGKSPVIEDKASGPADADSSDKAAKQDKGDVDSEASEEDGKSEKTETEKSKAEKQDKREKQDKDDKDNKEPRAEKEKEDSHSATAAEAAHEDRLSIKLEAPEKGGNDLVALLLASNFFSAGDLESAIVRGLKDPTVSVEILHAIGVMDKSSLDAAVRLQKLVKSGSVEIVKAISSLESLKAGKIKPTELTDQLGIKKPKRRK